MLETIFLFSLALIWIIFATIQDLKTREIANWLNFSLIAFALGFRFFYSLFYGNNFSFFYQGLIGLGIFVVLGNILYQGKMFAGGDAKLLIALGAILPVSNIFYENLQFFMFFMFLFLLVGALYSIIVSARICFQNYWKFKKEFIKQFKNNKKIIYFSLMFSIIFLIFGFYEGLFFILAILTFLIPYFYIYAKAVDETAMIKEIPVQKLREGDWLYKNLVVGGKTIFANWDGLSKKDITLLRKNYKKVKIREGVPFTPVFLISFLILFYLWVNGLRNPFW